MSNRFQDKVVLITGGGTGIGAASARWFAGEGAKVVVTGRRKEPIEHVAKDIGGLAVQADVAKQADCESMVAQAAGHFGAVDILVANAGIEAFGSVTELNVEEWHKVMAVNVDGVMLSARAVLPAMVDKGEGAIVIVASEAAITAGPHYATYNTSKTALIGLARSLAYDYGESGIRTNTVCPGWVLTEMSERETAEMAAERGVSVEQQMADLTRFMPIKRMGTPTEIAACIGFLASGEASFVNGAVLSADGGATVVDVGTLGFLS